MTILLESSLYGPAIVSMAVEGTHMKNSITDGTLHGVHALDGLSVERTGLQCANADSATCLDDLMI